MKQQLLSNTTIFQPSKIPSLSFFAFHFLSFIRVRNSIVNQGQNVISVPTDSNIKTGNYIISILSGNNATESITVPVIIK